ncbi:3-dehydroquinate synthase [Paenibacillus konkukensis]|uniref:3-dehydroquinate synthase n=1 Tax=Paenibacillus konkukensis TaxID=2020716 RepID=A0ABY4RIA9_9BACL|nr:3-dehydroquinate synthase [Paenibacillus konkukensis]UQZ81917.1 3-dehydroquinate synthase [Paenibacillus konkukensis]
MKELTVDLGERSYPIYIGEGILDQIGGLFDKHGISKISPILLVTDSHVAEHHLAPIMGKLQESGYSVVSHIVAAGEKSKSLGVLEDIVTTALQAGLDRKSTVVALGGGVVGDLAGFVAASYMRGIRFVQIPTTILAHDSSVGGKVAVNHPLAKNIIGAFHQPEMVLYDTATLQSLPERIVREGLSEMIKHGLIWDAEFTQWMEDNAEKLIALDQEALQYGLYQGCRVKSIVVSQDEKENDLRAILNLGHTIGHALEAVANYNELHHGEAISIGMVGSAKLAMKLGYPEHIYTVTKRILQKFGLPTRIPAHLDTDAIMSAMMHDKKFKEGTMVFIIPTAIGKVEINKNVSTAWVRDVVEQLKQEA